MNHSGAPKAQSASVLKNKNFFLLFQGALTSSVAATFYSFAISFYILEITGNNAAIQGAYLFVCGVVFVLVSFVGGVLADRWDRVKIVYGSDFLKGGLILLSLIFLHIFISRKEVLPQLILLFAIGVVNNVLAAVFHPASTALIPQVVSAEQLMQANSLFSIQNSVVSMLGIILAALFYSLFPITVLFLIIGVLYVISGITELFIRATHRKKDEALSLKLVVRDFWEGLRYLWGAKPVLAIVTAGLFVNFFIAPLTANFIPYMVKTDVAGSDYLLKELLSPESWSAVFSFGTGVGSVVMSVIMGNRRKERPAGQEIKRWFAVMSCLLIAAACVYAFTAGKNISVFLVFMTVGVVLIGFALVGINLPASVVVQRDVREDMLAKVTSISTIGCQGLVPFASLIAGFLLAQFGAAVLFFACAIGFALTTVFVCASKNISRL